MAGEKQVTDGRPDGAIFGQSATDTIGFYGADPVVRPSGASQASVAALTSSVATTGLLEAQAEALRVLVNKLRTDLIALGLIAGA